MRTWVAAFAALSVGSAYQVDYEHYRPIKEYIAGFGVMAARTAS
ncbi:2,3-dihydroxyphenylpropionate 1,2-dioxygenase [Nocardioides sp. YR527]|nr:hypothetical protein [Nocardioides sp. YR527]SDK33669.1 2,3-dihydroxyphenylpropionate 1,2-dioxygenase [Nocardioides sp. YR527]